MQKGTTVRVVPFLCPCAGAGPRGHFDSVACPDPRITMDLYVRSRPENLFRTAETVARTVIPPEAATLMTYQPQSLIVAAPTQAIDVPEAAISSQ